MCTSAIFNTNKVNHHVSILSFEAVPGSLKELLPHARKKQIGTRIVEIAQTPPATLESIDALSIQSLRLDESERADMTDTIDDLAVDVKENLAKRFEDTRYPQTNLAEAWHAIEAWEHMRTTQTKVLAEYVLEHLVGEAKDSLQAALEKAANETKPFSEALDEVNHQRHSN